MSQNSLNIYLTKNHNFVPTENNPNVFVYNENGLKNNAKWIKKNIEQNDCNYVIYDHNSCIYSTAKKYLLEQDYYVENITFKGNVNVSINPFDCIRDISDIHFMFLSFLHILWDENDETQIQEAIKWLKKAAAQGYAEAQLALIEMGESW